MKNKKKNTISPAPVAGSNLERRCRKLENCATFGLLLVCVGLAVPFFNLTQTSTMLWCRWIYAAGALIYILARAFAGNDPDESLRLRRLRRMEFWAGVAFCIGSAFWFYNMHRFSNVIFPGGGALSLVRDTVLFTLVGAALQLISSWMIYFRKKKESEKTHDN